MSDNEWSDDAEFAARLEQVRARDPEADGRFVYGVKSTGVFCRPSCGSRQALARNIVFFEKVEQARAAGYRACKRCRPEEPPRGEREVALVARLCRFIKSQDEAPSLAQLAAHVELSPHHVHRLFKAHTGLTPHAYIAAHRAARVRNGLRSKDTVTEAIFEAGYSSSGRFYESATERLGMTPSEFRKGGPDVAIRFAVGECSLGAILVAASGKGVCAISLGDEAEALVHELERQFPNAELVGADPDFECLVARVVGLVEAPQLGCDLPLDIRGTAFQERVWKALRAVPPGQRLTYGELARAIGEPKAARAVAGACAANTIAVAIPCHRVVRSDGSISGYRWGVERKRVLLEREGDS
ncbi:bifunctional DNA-binding transcriptional regulator/O6-methylguanine-DNA methyltransferase Ada [Lujinxingia vulgaris]|uniref:methylated-DNA--[protein]-cysteine S-methyltransferase n=1 Tax=Lujinxingia vulgaris TaxID=2600176 RepID=A0A5C6X3I3_9DELT|nr:bifunctional DNA-binding transcriptional regulator/O6-methylguanine-DNA methyltransferase Ada [Lujinxingia vulgaris]TXD35664.1 bifunctional DNA-binding transcriptional regulator/O6-methylguanine-DNA methyltransferase Ada [Lujinxingia vulgaris]